MITKDKRGQLKKLKLKKRTDIASLLKNTEDIEEVLNYILKVMKGEIKK